MAVLRKSDILSYIIHDKYAELEHRKSRGNQKNPNNLYFVYCNEGRKPDCFVRCINDSDECCENCDRSYKDDPTVFFRYSDRIIPRKAKIRYFSFWVQNMRECNCPIWDLCKPCNNIVRRILRDIGHLN